MQHLLEPYCKIDYGRHRKEYNHFPCCVQVCNTILQLSVLATGVQVPCTGYNHHGTLIGYNSSGSCAKHSIGSSPYGR
jgi:hypothetical protein